MNKKYLKEWEDWVALTFPIPAKLGGFIPVSYPYNPTISHFEGFSVQGLYNGYQLLPNFDSTTNTQSGVTVTRTALTQVYKFNGTATANSTKYIGENGLWATGSTTAKRYHLSAGQSITLSINIMSGDVSFDDAKFFNVRNMSGTILTSCSKSSPVTTYTSPDERDVIISQRLPSGVTFNNLTFTQMVEYGETAHHFEPYTGGAPSPSVSYPQAISDCSFGGYTFRSCGEFCDTLEVHPDGTATVTQMVQVLMVDTGAFLTAAYDSVSGKAYAKVNIPSMVLAPNNITTACPIAAGCPPIYKDSASGWIITGITAEYAGARIYAPAGVYDETNYQQIIADIAAYGTYIPIYHVLEEPIITELTAQETQDLIESFDAYSYYACYYDAAFNFISAEPETPMTMESPAFPATAAYYRLSMTANQSVDFTEARYSRIAFNMKACMKVQGGILSPEVGRYSATTGSAENVPTYIRTGAY